MDLHAQAWQALLAGEPFLHYQGYTDRLDRAASWISSSKPAAVLVDRIKPDPREIGRVVDELPGVGVLILVDSFDVSLILSLIRAGATGCISRGAGSARLVRAIIAVGRKELFLPPEIAQRVLIELSRDGGRDHEPYEQLTDREGEVLSNLAKGLTNKEIAQELMISVRTVEAHLRHIYGKLNVSSRTEAALWALENGYGPEDYDSG